MRKYEDVCHKEKPTHTLVVGDVNSTIACALVASKLGIKVIHVEAGLKSFDRTMPEKINRVLTDSISNILFTTEKSAEKNLIREGISKEKIYFVGNVMIDTLKKHQKKADESAILAKLGLMNGNKPKPYGVLTLHRPSNVDEKKNFMGIMKGIRVIADERPFIFPVHPRTRSRIKEFEFEDYLRTLSDGSKIKTDRGIYLAETAGYLDFLQLMS